MPAWKCSSSLTLLWFHLNYLPHWVWTSSYYPFHFLSPFFIQLAFPSYCEHFPSLFELHLLWPIVPFALQNPTLKYYFPSFCLVVFTSEPCAH
jgi:hypothetical protein